MRVHGAVGAAMVVAIAFVFMAFWVAGANNVMDLKKSGTRVKAQIVSHHTSRSSHSPTTYSLNYKFLVGDKTYQSSSDVSYSDYTSIKDGLTVNAMYDPTNPDNSRLAMAIGLTIPTSESVSDLICLLPCGFLIAGIALTVWRGRNFVRAITLNQ